MAEIEIKRVKGRRCYVIPGTDKKYGVTRSGHVIRLVGGQGVRAENVGQPLKPFPERDGRNRVTIVIDGDRKRILVAYLVITTISGKRVPAGFRIRHMNGDVTDDRFDNLRFSENPKESGSLTNLKRKALNVLIDSGKFSDKQLARILGVRQYVIERHR